MPESGIRLLRHEDILSYDEIRDFTRIAVGSGITKVRITGGEPLVRKGIVTLVGMLSEIRGITDLSMTTNGILLEQFAVQLAGAGLQRVNISLDTMESDKYRFITRGGDLNGVFRGIEAAKKANLLPVRINCVIKDSSDEKDARDVTRYCQENGLEVRYIKEMDLEKGRFSIVEGGTGGNCAICNRLRLTANGMLKPCLFNDMEFDIRRLGYEDALRKAVASKPEEGRTSLKNNFYNIGG
jgi:cyclic pyranopterin phosphate synthase